MINALVHNDNLCLVCILAGINNFTNSILKKEEEKSHSRDFIGFFQTMSFFGAVSGQLKLCDDQTSTKTFLIFKKFLNVAKCNLFQYIIKNY